MGPDDLNGYGYFTVRLYGTEAGFSSPCACEMGGACFKEFGTFFFTSIGFGVDLSQTSLLTTYCPDLLHLPTTTGEHCTGDVTNMGEAFGLTVWVFCIMKLFLREFFFFFFAELATSGHRVQGSVSDPPREPLVHLRP